MRFLYSKSFYWFDLIPFYQIILLIWFDSYISNHSTDLIWFLYFKSFYWYVLIPTFQIISLIYQFVFFCFKYLLWRDGRRELCSVRLGSWTTLGARGSSISTSSLSSTELRFTRRNKSLIKQFKQTRHQYFNVKTKEWLFHL